MQRHGRQPNLQTLIERSPSQIPIFLQHVDVSIHVVDAVKMSVVSLSLDLGIVLGHKSLVCTHRSEEQSLC